MASYVSSTIQPSQFDTPIYHEPTEFLFKVAEQKQAQFNAGINQAKQDYNNSLNLPVTSVGAIAKRDAFMQEAKQKLSKIASADFSLQENVAAANQIYKPLTQDKQIQLDLIKTESYKKGLSTSNMFETSKDEKERAQFNIFSKLNMTREFNNLRNAQNIEDLQKVDDSSFEYIAKPPTEVSTRIIEAVNKLNAGISIDNPIGQYIQNIKNGPNAVAAFTALGQTLSTPEDQKYYESVAKHYFNSTKDRWVQSGMSEQSSLENSVNEIIDKQYKQTNTEKQGVEAIVNQIQKSIQKDEDNMTSNLSEEQRHELGAVIAQKQKQLQEYKTKLTNLSNTLTNLDKNKPTEEFNKYYQNLLINPIPYIGKSLLNEKVYEAANSIAATKYESTLKENPIAKRIQEHEFKLKEIEFEQRQKALYKTDGNSSSVDETKNSNKTDVTIENAGKNMFNIPTYKISDFVNNYQIQMIKQREAVDDDFIKSTLGYSIDEKMFEGIESNNPQATNKVLNAIQIENKGKQPNNLSNDERSFLSKITGLSINNETSNQEIYDKLVEKANNLSSELLDKAGNNQTKINDYSRINKLAFSRKTLDARISAIAQTQAKISSEILSKKPEYKTLTVTENINGQQVTRTKTFEEAVQDHTIGNNFDDYGMFSVEGIDQQTINKLLNRNVYKYTPEYGMLEDIDKGIMYQISPEQASYLKSLKYNVSQHVYTNKGYVKTTPDFNAITKKYDDKFTDINNQTAKLLLNTKNIAGLTFTQGKNDEVGIQQNTARLVSGSKQNDQVDALTRKVFLNNEYQEDLLQSNAEQLGLDLKSDNQAFKTVINTISSILPEVEEKDKSVMIELTPIGKDNKSTEYNFKFSNEALKILESKFSAKDNPAEYKIVQKIKSGIKLNRNNIDSSIEKDINNNTLPYVAMLESAMTTNPNTSKVTVGKIDDDNYIEISTDGRQNVYRVIVHYTDPVTNEKKTLPREFGQEQTTTAIQNAYQTLLANRVQSKLKSNVSKLSKEQIRQYTNPQ